MEKSSLVKLGENKEIKNLREALGEYPYRYEFIKQVCDADSDGLHINVLIILIFLKLYPDIIEEGRLKIVLPPLYCAKAGNTFIPIYNVDEYEKYKKNKKYICQRVKGLGEFSAPSMRVVLNQGIEYTVKMPKNKKVIDKIINIILSTEEKQKYLNKPEYNFDSFIAELFAEKEGK